jgi:MFS family permease
MTRRAPTALGRAGPRLSFRLLLGVCTLATCGYSVLLSVVPLWVARGGSGAFGAGTTTGVFMLTTVATQLGVPWLLRRYGHRMVLGVGLVLLGAPAPLLALSAELPPVLVLSALRGIGFGLFTVASGALVGELAPATEHGRSTALFGMATGVPQLLLLPTGVGVVEHLGFTGVFMAAALPLLGLALLPFMRSSARTAGPTAGAAREASSGLAPGVAPSPDLAPPPLPNRPGDPRTRRRAGLLGPALAMLTCATAQGALITFLPLAVAASSTGGRQPAELAGWVSAVVPIALFGTAGGALVGRVVAGQLVDRRGMGGRLLGPGMLLSAVGMLAEMLVARTPSTGVAVLLAGGAVLVGFGFGLVQNDSMVTMFATAGATRYGRASAVWNIAYDAGTGAGAVGLGAVAQLFGFQASFAAGALLLVLVAPLTRGSAGRRPASPRGGSGQAG